MTKSKSSLMLSLRIAGVIIAIGLALSLVSRLPDVAREASHRNLAIVWLTSIFLFFAAISPSDALSRIRAAMLCWPKWRWYFFGVGVITVTAFVLRAWRNDIIPPVLQGDEATFAMQSQLVLGHEIRNPFVTGFLSQPTLIFYYGAFFIKLLGPTIFALRIPWAIVGTLTVPVVWLLVRRLQGTAMAFATAAILMAYHFHIHYSRINLGNIADPLFGSLALLFLIRALSRSNSFDWALMGASCGFALYFYTGARFTLILVAFVVGYALIRERHHFLSKHHVRPLFALAAFLIIAAPMIQHAILDPDDFNGRINQVGIFRTGWLEHTAMQAGESKALVIWNQFVHAALAFNCYSDRAAFYNLNRPLLDPVFGTLFLFGLGYALFRSLKFDQEGDRLFPMVAWFLGGTFFGGALTLDPPSSQRLVSVTVPVCFFISLGMVRLCQLAKEAIPSFPARSVLAVGVAAFSIISLRMYFLDWTPRRISGGPHAELATDIAPTLNDWKANSQFFFLGAPAMYWGFPTLPFLVSGADAVDWNDPLTTPPSPNLIPSNRGGVFIILPHRLPELSLIRQSFPEGRVQEFRSPYNKRLMVTLYRVYPKRPNQ